MNQLNLQSYQMKLMETTMNTAFEETSGESLLQFFYGKEYRKGENVNDIRKKVEYRKLERLFHRIEEQASESYRDQGNTVKVSQQPRSTDTFRYQTLSGLPTDEEELLKSLVSTEVQESRRRPLKVNVFVMNKNNQRTKAFYKELKKQKRELHFFSKVFGKIQEDNLMVQFMKDNSGKEANTFTKDDPEMYGSIYKNASSAFQDNINSRVDSTNTQSKFRGNETSKVHHEKGQRPLTEVHSESQKRNASSKCLQGNVENFKRFYKLSDEKNNRNISRCSASSTKNLKSLSDEDLQSKELSPGEDSSRTLQETVERCKRFQKIPRATNSSRFSDSYSRKNRSRCSSEEELINMDLSLAGDYEVNVDVSQFQSDEISINVVDQIICIRGKQKSSGDGHQQLKLESLYKVNLPNNANMFGLESWLFPEAGVLSICVPKKKSKCYKIQYNDAQELEKHYIQI